jgi:hypothetical protein
MGLWAAMILAVGLVLAALAHGGVYEIVAGHAGGQSDSGTPSFFRVNKFTGSAVWCAGVACFAVERPE